MIFPIRCFFQVGLIGLMLLIQERGLAQTATLSGRVSDAASGQPLPFASVFVNATTRGTTADDAGRYTLTGVPLGSIEVVASYVGYAPAKQALRLESAQPRRLDLTLAPTGTTLGDVVVKAGKNKTWLRQVRILEQQLIGNSPFASQCELTNPDVLRFEEANRHLLARADAPLVFENRALGYRLHYQLIHFDYLQPQVFYGGNSRFEELKPADERQARRWNAARRQAYTGSTRHLVASLIAGNYEAEGFLVYGTDSRHPPATNPPDLTKEVNRYLLPLKPGVLVQPGGLPFERRIGWSTSLAVYFTRPLSNVPAYRNGAYAFSQILLPNGFFETNLNGFVTKPNGMEVRGFLGNDRLATLLPADWNPDGPTGTTPTPPPTPEGQSLPPDARLDSLTRRWARAYRAALPGVFLHTDKDFYAAGDGLWLSAYALDALTHQPATGDHPLHVDLLSLPDGKFEQRLVAHQWLRLREGRAAGEFWLSDTLSTGTYRLRAYWETEGLAPRPAFERSLTVYNLNRGTGRARRAPGADLDVQALPEGGHWVAGIPARLGLKVLDPEGQGRAVTMQVLDADGKEVARLNTNALGMGSLPMTPQPGQRYRVRARLGVFSGEKALPSVEEEGLTLRADLLSDSTQLGLLLHGSARYRTEAVYVVVQSRGQVRHEARLRLQDGKARLSVPLAKLPAGLAQVALFDSMGRPWAERLVFVPETRLPLRVRVFPEKATYAPRDTVTLNLAVDAPGGASLSVSVTDAEQLSPDSTVADLRAHLLLTGELRGRVEQPNFYFKNSDPATRQALDDLLLTQGWRRVTWTDSLLAPPDTLPEPGMVLRGRLFDQATRQPLTGARLAVSSNTPGQLYGRTVTTDAQGRFQLTGLVFTDTVRVLMQATDRAGKIVRALLIPENTEGWFAEKTPVPFLLPNWLSVQPQVQAAQLRQRSDPEAYRDPGARLLNEVVVKRRAAPPPRTGPKSVSLHGRADVVVTFDEKSPRFANVYDMLLGRAAGVHVNRKSDGSGYDVLIRGISSLRSGTSPLFLLDGIYLEENSSGTALMAINPNDVERIEVVKNSGAAMYGSRGANGIVAFYTKIRDASSESVPGPTSEFTFVGYRTQRQFYAPDKPTAPEATRPRDVRDVLAWFPLLPTDAQGKARIAFPLSDMARRLRVSVQGITADGQAVGGVEVLEVGP